MSYAFSERYRAFCLFVFSLCVLHTLISCFHVEWFAFYSFLLSETVLEKTDPEEDRFTFGFLDNYELLMESRCCFFIDIFSNFHFYDNYCISYSLS
jgi:hypothetical protein